MHHTVAVSGRRSDTLAQTLMLETHPAQHIRHHSPIIVDDRYELAETVAIKQGGEPSSGLLAKPDFQTALLSMSGYDHKHNAASLDGSQAARSAYPWAQRFNFDNSRFFRHGEAKASQSNVDDLRQATGGSIIHSPPELNYDLTSLYSSRTPSEVSQRPVNDASVRAFPEVKSFNPERGLAGSHLHIYLRSEYDLFAPPGLIVNVVFGSKSVLTDTTRLETSGAAFEYVVLATAPQFQETASPSSSVALRVQLQETTGQNFGVLFIGNFEYTSTQPPAPQQQTTSRKRKVSGEFAGQAAAQSAFDSYDFLADESPSYLGNIDPSNTHKEAISVPHAHLLRSDSEPVVSQDHSHALMQPPGQNASTWNPSLTLASRPSTFDHPSMSSTTVSSRNPEFIRTTTLQHGGSLSPPAGPANNFNPYTFPQKAVLKLNGDLNSMTENWTADEWSSKRRLVQFTRSQHKSAINAGFTPVALEDRQLNSICISCIWWEERQEYFATSVDTIYLLEQLVAVRFTVEEKNRIRRNLEGFHPETVSKAKADSEEFFKIIMGFPNPKPRNIEKDVKVFPWKILGHALKKIISKYSASYSSTAGALGRPRPSVAQSYDQQFYDAPATTGATLASNFTPTLSSNMSPHSSAHHFPSTPLSSSLSDYPTFDSAQSTPFLPSHSAISAAATMAGMANADGYADLRGHHQHQHQHQHFRSGSVSDLDPPHNATRPFKRPRANTSNATLYSHPMHTSTSNTSSHHASPNSNSMYSAAHLLGEMSRSYSDHGATAPSTPLRHSHHHHGHHRRQQGQTTPQSHQFPLSGGGTSRLASVAESYVLHSGDGAGLEQVTGGASGEAFGGYLHQDGGDGVEHQA